MINEGKFDVISYICRILQPMKKLSYLFSTNRNKLFLVPIISLKHWIIKNDALSDLPKKETFLQFYTAQIQFPNCQNLRNIYRSGKKSCSWIFWDTKNNVCNFILAMNHDNQIKTAHYLVEHETVIFQSRINAIQFLADFRSIRNSY